MRNLPLGTCLDYLAMRLNHPEAAGQEIALNFMMADCGLPQVSLPPDRRLLIRLVRSVSRPG